MTDKSLISAPHKNFEEIKKNDKDGVEYWEARKLMPLLGYTRWENFEKVINKSKKSCKKSGQTITNHFLDITKMVTLGSGSKRKVQDYKLSRYACYLIAQNGDPSKQEIANAQTYFAIQTRRQEVFQQLGEDGKRIYIREQVKDHNKKLFATAQQAGVSNFGSFNDAGYLGLYKMRLSSVTNKKNLGKDKLLDRAGTTELAANLFRITQTDEKIKREEVAGQKRADETHFRVGRKVRKTI
ncbi:DNA damage-inducible protein D, partial [Patescibacteria group bacterium]|nr:DNA damage-inducible protein D [Patescibacteria group bacterium]